MLYMLNIFRSAAQGSCAVPRRWLLHFVPAVAEQDKNPE